MPPVEMAGCTARIFAAAKANLAALDAAKAAGHAAGARRAASGPAGYRLRLDLASERGRRPPLVARRYCFELGQDLGPDGVHDVLGLIEERGGRARRTPLGAAGPFGLGQAP